MLPPAIASDNASTASGPIDANATKMAMKPRLKSKSFFMMIAPFDLLPLSYQAYKKCVTGAELILF